MTTSRRGLGRVERWKSPALSAKLVGSSGPRKPSVKEVFKKSDNCLDLSGWPSARVELPVNECN